MIRYESKEGGYTRIRQKTVVPKSDLPDAKKVKDPVLEIKMVLVIEEH